MVRTKPETLGAGYAGVTYGVRLVAQDGTVLPDDPPITIRLPPKFIMGWWRWSTGVCRCLQNLRAKTARIEIPTKKKCQQRTVDTWAEQLRIRHETFEATINGHDTEDVTS